MVQILLCLLKLIKTKDKEPCTIEKKCFYKYFLKVDYHFAKCDDNARHIGLDDFSKKKTHLYPLDSFLN